MKRIIGIFLIMVLLTGCGKGSAPMEQALHLRGSLQGKPFQLEAVVTADYGDAWYAFRLQCTFDGSGAMAFTVLEPETISGITGTVSAKGGALTFDDVALAFDILADGQLSPISAPWVMMQALLGGYITSAGVDGDYTRITVKDSYRDDAMTVDLWVDGENLPVQGDILWKDRRILSVRVEKFTLG